MYSSLRRERRTVLLEPGGQTVCAPIVNPTRLCATPRNPACHRPSPAWRARQAWSDYTHRNLGRRTLVGRLAHHAGEIGNTPDGLTSQTFRLKSEAFITEGKNLAHAVRFGPRTVADVAPLPPTHRRPAIISGKVIYRTVASWWPSTFRRQLDRTHLSPPRSSCLCHHPTPHSPHPRSKSRISANEKRPPVAASESRSSFRPRLHGSRPGLLGEAIPGVRNARKRFCTPGHFSWPRLFYGPNPAKQPLTKEIDPPDLRENRHDASAPLSRHQIQTPLPPVCVGGFSFA